MHSKEPRPRRWALCVAITLGLGLGSLANAQRATAAAPSRTSPPSPCDPNALTKIPRRAADAPTGSQFAERVRGLAGPARDAVVVAQVLAGDMPGFLRHLVPVTVRGTGLGRPVAITVCVLPDYLAVGSNRDFLFVPVGLKAAVTIADRFGFVLPTPKLVDAIYDASPVKLSPQPLPASDAMRSTDYVVLHNGMIQLQRREFTAKLGELTSGDKKDLVLTSRLWELPGRVAIYGWHRGPSAPIQPLSTVHGARYADYSHGVRLVSEIVYVNGAAREIKSVLADRILASALTREGPLARLSERLAALEAQ